MRRLRSWRWIISISLALTLGLAAMVYAAPLLTLYQIKVAADASDAARLDRLIDFPSFRLSAKGIVRQKLNDRFGDPEGHSALRSIGKSLTNAVAGSAVDWFLTPQGVSRLVRGQASSKSPQSLGDIPEIRFGYQSTAAFEVRVRERRPDADRIVLTLLRDGWSWRLVAVRLE